MKSLIVTACLALALILFIVAYVAPFITYENFTRTRRSDISLWYVYTSINDVKQPREEAIIQATIAACDEQKEYWQGAQGAGGLALIGAGLTFIVALMRLVSTGARAMYVATPAVKWINIILQIVLNVIFGLIFWGLMAAIYNNKFCEGKATETVPYKTQDGFYLSAALPCALIAFIVCVVVIVLEFVMDDEVVEGSEPAKEGEPAKE